MGWIERVPGDLTEDDAMGLLDELLGGVLGGGAGQLGGGAGQQGGWRPAQGAAPAGGGGASIMMALLPVVLSMLSSGGGGGRQGGGGLGDILGQVLGGGAGSRGGAALGAGGGLGGLLEQMQRAGFGDQASSWVSTGQNMPISPDAIGKIFGQGGLAEIARHANLTPEETSEGLSQLLPEVVDRVTPGGQQPDFDQLTRSVDAMRRQLGG